MCAINLQKIKDLAKLKNISIRELAFKIGCTDGGLYKMINNNKISVDTLQAIAEALEVNIAYNDLRIPKDTISQALGHQYGSRVTSVYIDADSALVDDANRRVIDWVFYGKK